MVQRDLRSVEDIEIEINSLEKKLKEKKSRKDRYWKNKKLENLQSKKWRLEKKIKDIKDGEKR